ncbi:DUF2971 domain-containing protein [Thalassolituus sp. ST750PaO-4]|uniref:DUF2971 domain-containing protein n=1 Tax=Thalassolituus sp. ST750PaO-4 TaxID=2742965 RepID=UPI001CE314B5|nr:DUF2971 domain-containing protein [Thalassolituus sp. ST750PaO-4]
MSAITDHPCFNQPKNQEARLWRYMDFTKFVSLLESESLFFCRADLFKDPFEGSYSKANVALRPHVYKDMPAEQLEKMTTQMADFSKWIRGWTYINCWHANKHESAAMWDLYAKTNEAVAIETNYSKLKDALPENVYIGLVNYIDYDSEWLPEGNSFYPFMHKRKSFEHEKEVRAVIQELPNTENGIAVGKENQLFGLDVKVNLNTLIKTVHISPTAPKWFADLVSNVASRYGLSAPVNQSLLYSEPVY